MRLWVQFLVLVAVVVILAEQNGVEAKKNKQKHGRSQEKSPAKSGQNKENSRKVRDVSNSKEKYNKKEEVKYTKQTKKNTKNDNKEKKNNEFVDKKSLKQDKKQGNKATEYVDKKIDKKQAKNKNEKNVKTEEIVKEEAVEEEGIEEIAPEETEIATNEGGEEMEIVEKEPSVKGTGDKLVQCNKKTDSVETNLTETCQKYKSEKNLKVVEKVHSSSVASGACDACKS